MKKIATIVLTVLLSSLQLNGQTISDLQREIDSLKRINSELRGISENSKMDFLLFSYKPKKEKKDTSRFIDEKLEKFYDKKGITRIDLEVSENGTIESIVDCIDILNLGLCANLESYDGIFINTPLKSKPTDTLFHLFVKKFPSDSSGNVFIRLADIFEEALNDQPHESNYCCPEDDKETRKKKQEELLRDKLCHILEFPNGIEIYLTKKGKAMHRVHLKRVGRSRTSRGSGEFVKIEPRQYVTIYEKKKLNSTPQPIWYLEKKPDKLGRIKFRETPVNLEKFYGKQEFAIVDSKAILEVKFDQEILAENIDFYGNISLRANVGDRKIEVAPYFVTGQQQKSYGVNSKPIKEIADYFLSLMIEATKARSLYKNFEDDIQRMIQESRPLDKNTQTRLISSIRNLKLYLERAYDEDSLIAHNRLDLDVIKEIMDGRGIPFILDHVISNPLYLFLHDNSNRRFKVGELTRELESLEIQLTGTEIRKKWELNPDSLTEKNELWQKFLSASRKCWTYMDYISASGDNSLEAFLGFTLINKLDFQNIKSILRSSIEYLETYQRFEDLALARGKHAEIDFYLLRLIISINNLKTNGSVIDKLLEDRNLNPDFISNDSPINRIPRCDEIDSDVSFDFKKIDWEDVKEEVLPYVNSLDTVFKTPIKSFLNDSNGFIPDDTSDTLFQFVQSLITQNEFQRGNRVQDGLWGQTTKQSIDRALLRFNISADNLNDAQLIALFLYLYEDYGMRDLEILQVGIPLWNENNCYEQIIWRLLEKGDDTVLEYDFYNKITSELARLAGLALYNKLVYATIDLGKASLNSGDFLEISVMWYNINGYSEEENGIALATAKFLIKDTGWALDASESALLIERINENLVTQNVSSSNYKPTAGASLLWTYSTDKRGNQLTKILKWFEPSIGLNVSYADFDSTKDFEIGVGPIIGLWQNKVFVTYGKNFRVGGKSPYYFGVGFSFLNVFQTIKGKIEQQP